jgi:hypothetical protein
MEERTWQLFTKAACSRDRRVTEQVTSQASFGTRTQPFPRLELDDGDCSCHPRRKRAQTAA